MSSGPDAAGNANLRAIAYMLAATVAFTSMHAMIRQTAQDLHPFEVAFFRNFFGLIFLAPFILRAGPGVLRTAHLKVHGLRAILNLVSMLAFFYALTVAPFAEITALTFTAPIFLTVLATVVLREKVGILRWSAVVIGFTGALVILRPGFAVVGLGPLLTIFSALIWAVAMIIIKKLTRTEASVTITAYMMIFLTPLSLIAAVPVWTWSTTEQYVLLFVLAALGTSGHLLLNQALKEGDTSLISPVDFIRLVWAALIGYFAFGEFPDGLTWLGGIMICASAGFVAYREGRRRK